MNPDEIIKKIQYGDSYCLEKLLKENPEKVNQYGDSHLTYLMAACERGNIDLVRLLLKARPFLNVNGTSGKTALHFAVNSAYSRRDIVALLIENGACINSQDVKGNTPLHLAVQKGSYDLVHVILNTKGKYTVWINQLNFDNETPLYLACEKGHTRIVCCLLSFSANVDMNVDKTPLNAACYGNKADIVRLLLQQAEPYINKVYNGYYDDTPLHWAVENQHYDIVELILSKNSVKLDMKNHNKMTPLLLAISGGHLGIIQKLISRGADINAVDGKNCNCLHYAVFRNTFHSEEEPLHILDEYAFKLSLTRKDRLSGMVIACYLAHSGANFYHKNNKYNQEPLDLIQNPDIKTKIATLFPRPPPPCMWCKVNKPTVTFQPCGHVVLCNDCYVLIKCTTCHKCGNPLSSESECDEPQVDDQATCTCTICMERRWNMVFECGHTSCKECGEKLASCHLCRKQIEKRITVNH